MVVVQPLSDLGGRLRDGVDDVPVDQLHLEVGEGRCLLHRCKRGDERRKLMQLNAGNAEIFDGAQGLNSVERARRHVTLSEQVALATRRSRQIDARPFRRFEAESTEAGRMRRFHA